jgi:hypothetical protein
LRRLGVKVVGHGDGSRGWFVTEGVIIFHEWGEGSPLSVHACPLWVVVVLRWGVVIICGQSMFVNGGGRQRLWSFPLVEGGVVIVPRRGVLR